MNNSIHLSQRGLVVSNTEQQHDGQQLEAHVSPVLHASIGRNNHATASHIYNEHVRPSPTLQTQGYSSSTIESPNYVQTPLSTTSLSSPFSQYPGGQYLSTPSSASHVSSPMSSRIPNGYAAPYNPQEWGPVGRSSPRVGNGGQLSQFPGPTQHVITHLRHSTDDPIGSPPPPYSPRHNDGTEPSQPTRSSTMSTSMSASTPISAGQYPSPISAATTMSPDLSTMSQRMTTTTSPQSQWTGSFPPPPPPGSNRSSSRPTGDRLFSLSALTGRSRQSTPPSAIQIPSQMHDSPSYQNSPSNVAARPPASRRAVSASGVASIQSSHVSVSHRVENNSSPGWTSGMPLPPPPPGPPPAASRSQSTSGLAHTGSGPAGEFAPRHRARQISYQGPSLGAVPPTPAGWVDEDYAITAAAVENERSPPSLHINTTDAVTRPSNTRVVDETSFPPAPTLSSPPNRNSTHGLFRSTAIRDPSAKGIRERRSESRNNRQRAPFEPDILSSVSTNNPWHDEMEAVKPANLNLSNDRASSSRLSMLNTGPSGTPKETPGSSRVLSGGLPTDRTTPRINTAPLHIPLDHLTNTPPFSPAGDRSSSPPLKGRSPGLPPKALPTPPPQQYSRPPSSSSLNAPSSASDRPVSHLLHLPNDSSAIPAPLTPRRPPDVKTDIDETKAILDQAFFSDASKRYERYLKQEQEAENETEKLRIFTDFVISESAIRRRRYAAAWDQGAVDLDVVREKIFTRQRSASRRGSGLRVSTMSSPEEQSSRPDTQWWGSYQPILSPIAASMSNSGPDEMESRGRAPSRWWESQTGSSEGHGRRVEKRSKREMKYMGVAREDREAMQYEPDPSGQPETSSSAEQAYDPDEYPGKAQDRPQSLSYPAFNLDSSLADTPKAPDEVHAHRSPPIPKLDVSRFVTLPPPYPRHYPAVQNNHPDLVVYRKHVRTVVELGELKDKKKQYLDSSNSQRQADKEKREANRKELRSRLSQELSQGSISFAEAAQAEATFNQAASSEDLAAFQSEFSSYQEKVLNPLQDLLNSRLSATSNLINQLQATLSTEAQQNNPNQSVAEEGDEQPELLEKLTALKWLFEARETLHREMYNLEAERSEKYKELVTFPYKQSNNAAKLRDTNAFFTQDEATQKIKFEQESVERWKGFLASIEEYVAQAVEVQLCAFWDIAPNLVSLLHQIPEADFSERSTDGHTNAVGLTTRQLQKMQENQPWAGIQIPASEFKENPAYVLHPMQYLYTLLDHAEKSTYQFIEAQINLLCLLHEVRCGSLGAGRRLEEAQRVAEITLASVATGAETETERESAKQEVREKMEKKEADLTNDLKERVQTVQSLWTEALGSRLLGVKERVRDWLVSTEGWEGMEGDD